METVETSADPTALRQESKQVMEIAQVSLTKESDKQTVGTHTIEYYSLTKREQITDTGNNTNDSQRHYMKGKETQKTAKIQFTWSFLARKAKHWW